MRNPRPRRAFVRSARPAVSRAISAPSRRCACTSRRVQLHAARPRFGEPVRKARLPAKASDRRGKPSRVVRRDQQAVHLVGDDVGMLPCAPRPQGPERHRLHEDERRHLARREQQCVRGQQSGGDVGGRPREVDLAAPHRGRAPDPRLGRVGAVGLDPEASARPRPLARAAPGRRRSRRPGAVAIHGADQHEPDRIGGAQRARPRIARDVDADRIQHDARACAVEGRAIHGEIATTVCASAPCTRNSRLAATVLGASCACTMTGTPASRAPMTRATRMMLWRSRRRSDAASRAGRAAPRPGWNGRSGAPTGRGRPPDRQGCRPADDRGGHLGERAAQRPVPTAITRSHSSRSARA